MRLNEFYSGDSFDSYNWLGAHYDGKGTMFRVFAPHADNVALIGSFSGWSEINASRIEDGSFWGVYVAGAKPGDMYKYRIYSPSGVSDRADPYAFGSQLRPENASIIRDMRYEFDDFDWMTKRGTWHGDALNIYELHLGAWMTDHSGKDVRYTYSELAPRIVDYCKKHYYNFIEIMPLNEYPCDESWGYQATGFFAPTARYGEARQLKKLINMCHKHNIGVIIDFVPVHFAVDGFALAQFDGSPLYESEHKDIAYSEWGSINFDFSKGHVRSFLKSAANYWLSEYHFDGLRMDAISRVIYWMGEPQRGVNSNGLNFLKSMNTGLKWIHPSAILCAEDSTDYPYVTKSTADGGLGFDYKWDMGWMNDTLDYMKKPPEERVPFYHELSFSMLYNYSEKYILPLSHDENVHGKATVMQKMYGGYEDKFPQARTLYMYMYAHPGKKLNFSGGEIGQLREWDEKRGQDWELLKYPMHDSFSLFMKKLCRLYLKKPVLSRWDDDPNGFAWLDCDSALRRCYTIIRRCEDEKPIVAVFNFSDRIQENYRISIGQGKLLSVLLDSTSDELGGCAPHYRKTYKADKNGCVTMNVPRYSSAYFELREAPPKKTR
ncbi:MAG: 1,4-alpha-glucan branching protein GlgB [Oscillospiraceae bacterium]